MGVAALVFAGAVIGGALSAPTSIATLPQFLIQPTAQNVGPITYISRHHSQDELGQFNYGFSHPGQAKNELRDSTGNVAGSYSYVDDDDKIVVVEYTAGEHGFQVTSNNLPVAVSDTPEVLAAKLDFVEQYNAAALAAASAAANDKKQVADPSISNIAIPVQVSPNPVKDMPEVIAAKLKFVEAYNTAAIAAANAPDDPAAPSKVEDFRSEISENSNPIKDTPEVIAAKLQFVEAYNAAALAAAKVAENPQANDFPKVAVVYGLPVVQDNPAVLAAKLKFVEDYNAAAMAAAFAPDNNAQNEESSEISSATEKSSEGEIVTELGILAERTSETTLLPIDGDENIEHTTILPVHQEEEGKESVKKAYPLIPVKVDSSPDETQDESQDKSTVTVKSQPATDYSLYKYSYSNPGVYAPQVYYYGEAAPQKPVVVEATATQTSVYPKPAYLPNIEDQRFTLPMIYMNRYHAQDELGQFNYGYSYPGRVQNEFRDASGNVAGRYSYLDEENNAIHVEYTAGKDGFQVKSNNLPIAVQDTPEVLAAKLQFVEAYNAAALAAANAPDEVAESNAHGEDDTAAQLTNRNPIKDTPEVLAAKLQFVEAYNTAALAAANAPDDPSESSSPEEDSKVSTLGNPHAIKDSPEVLAAKLQFVETYNAAAISAAKGGNEAGQEDISKATLSYAFHPVRDTPEVIEAKIKFVEAYNAAALASAMAADDEILQHNQERNQEEVGTSSAAQLTPVAGDSYSVIPAFIPTSLQVPAVSTSVSYSTRHHAQDELGQVNYGFSSPDQTKSEVRDVDGNVVGSFSYIDSENKVINVKYTAGDGGFQVVSNNLPVAPTDTPEVLAAKLQFVEAYNAASLAAAEAPDDKEQNGSSSKNEIFVVPNAVKDTPEVLAAKLQFVDAYNAAAIAAANAPDDQNIVSHIDEDSTILDPMKDIPEETKSKLDFVEAYNTAVIAAASAGDTSDTAATISFASHPVRDTPAVIAAKIAFVEAYNAAALAAAAAPDDDVIYDTTLEPIEDEAATVLGERLTENPSSDAIIDTENFVVSDLPEVSQPLEELEKTSKVTGVVDPVPSVQYHTLPSSFARYAGYLPASDGSHPTIYTYSVPYGLYGLNPIKTSPKGFPFSIQFVPAQLIQQDLGKINNDLIMYAPYHTY